MIDSQHIYYKAKRIIFSSGTRDPFKIAEDLGLLVNPVDYFKNLLGMYVCKYKIRAIYINNKMDEYLSHMVVAHEIGHDIFHKALAKENGLKEFELFRMKSIAEYEANAFASHILIDTDEFLELCQNGYDVTQISKEMNTEINLALIKLQEMIKLGYDLRLPMEVHGDFLKRLRVE